MRTSQKWMVVLVFAFAAALASYLPLARASDLLPEGRAFSGFMLNPIDGNTYLSKMRQGLEGQWLFRLDYAAQPGEAVFLYPFYLALGHLAGWLGAELIDVFHLVRVVMMILMLLAAYTFLERFVQNSEARWLAFTLILIGAGQGWLGLVAGVEASDLMIPESVPFLAGYVNAHFPLAISLVLMAVWLIFADETRLALRIVGGLGCGLLLALVLPFSCLSLVLAVGAWLVWEMAGVVNDGWRAWWESRRNRILTCGAVAAGMAPILAYDAWIVLHHPVISQWTFQNQTPSPPIVSYAFGFGVALLLALAAAYPYLRINRSEQRFLYAWMITGLISLYLPIGLQRRLSLGLFFPIIVLAVAAWERWFRGRRWGTHTAILIVVLSIPSNLIVIGAGLSAVSAGEPNITYPAEEQAAYSWIADQLPGQPLFLCSPEVGNRLPAYTNARVIYGHPFETPQAVDQLIRVEALFSSADSAAQGLAQIQELEVEFVFYGPGERQLGTPAWLNLLMPVHERQGITIFQVP